MSFPFRPCAAPQAIDDRIDLDALRVLQIVVEKALRHGSDHVEISLPVMPLD